MTENLKELGDMITPIKRATAIFEKKSDICEVCFSLRIIISISNYQNLQTCLWIIIHNLSRLEYSD